MVAATTGMEAFCWKEKVMGSRRGAEVQKQVTKVIGPEHHAKLLNAFMLLEGQRKGRWTYKV